jgi:hypothetical protein
MSTQYTKPVRRHAGRESITRHRIPSPPRDAPRSSRPPVLSMFVSEKKILLQPYPTPPVILSSLAHRPPSPFPPLFPAYVHNLRHRSSHFLPILPIFQPKPTRSMPHVPPFVSQIFFPPCFHPPPFLHSFFTSCRYNGAVRKKSSASTGHRGRDRPPGRGPRPGGALTLNRCAGAGDQPGSPLPHRFRTHKFCTFPSSLFQLPRLYCGCTT